jgi:hypothetical protein
MNEQGKSVLLIEEVKWVASYVREPRSVHGPHVEDLMYKLARP